MLIFPCTTWDTIATFFAHCVNKVVERQMVFSVMEILKLLAPHRIAFVELRIVPELSLAFRIVNTVDGLTIRKVAVLVVSGELALLTHLWRHVDTLARSAKAFHIFVRVACVTATHPGRGANDCSNCHKDTKTRRSHL